MQIVWHVKQSAVLSSHSSIVFRSSAFRLHRRDISSGSLPITFQIQIQTVGPTRPRTSNMVAITIIDSMTSLSPHVFEEVQIAGPVLFVLV